MHLFLSVLFTETLISPVEKFDKLCKKLLLSCVLDLLEINNGMVIEHMKFVQRCEGKLKTRAVLGFRGW